MPTLQPLTDINASIRDLTQLIYNIQISQVSGSDDQARVTFSVPAGLDHGTIYARFKSAYNGTDGKQEIAGAGGFTVTQPLADLQGATQVTLDSAANLVIGTTYHALIYWVEDGYTGDHWSGVAGEVFPVGNAIEQSSPLTITAVAAAPSSISGNLSVTEGAAAGTLLGTLSADIQGCTFSELTPDLAWAEVNSNGQVVVAAGQTAPTPGSASLEVRATNSVGTYDATITITVNAQSTGGGAKLVIPMPAQNGPTFANVAAVQAALSSLEANWNTTMTGWGLATTDKPVIGLAAGSHGTLNLSSLDFRGEQLVTVRGVGAFGNDGWTPTSTVQCGRLVMANVHNLQVAGIQFEITSGSHTMDNCTFAGVFKCGIYGDPARSTSAAAISPTVSSMFLISNNSDCWFTGNAFIGGKTRQLGAINTVNTRMLINWNVWDQQGNDLININGGVNNDWVVANNLPVTRGRNPQGQHQDFIQVFSVGGTAVAHGWYCTGNFIITGLSWGSDTHCANQGFYWGDGSSATEISEFYDNMFANTNGGVKGVPLNSDAISKFNGQCLMEDVLYFEGTTYSSNWGGLGSANVADENIVPQKATSIVRGAGPNGIHIYMPNTRPSDVAPASDWSEQYLYYEGPFIRGGPLRQWRAVVGSRAHWDHADPTGCFDLQKRVYDATDHQHWKDQGWPVAPAAHNACDPQNDMGGASGNYTSFDADGLYLG